jgi:hypothetical protein
MADEAVAVERVRVGVLARLPAVVVVVVAVVDEVDELAVGEEEEEGEVVAFAGEEEAFAGDDVLLGVDEDGVDGSGNSLGWCRVDTMVEGVSEVDGQKVDSEFGALVV